MRECRVRDLREMGAGWARGGREGGREGGDVRGAGRAMTERRWRARRDAGMLGGFSVVISATGAGERSVFPENVTQRVLRPQTALFHPFFYVFSALAHAGGLGTRFAAHSHRVTRAAPLLSARISLAVITPSLVCQTQNKIISKRFTRFASFFLFCFCVRLLV